MSWGAQNRSKDAKTPSVGRGMSENPEPDLRPVQQYAQTALQPTSQSLATVQRSMALAGSGGQAQIRRRVARDC
jgi:hypothetical protein